MLRRSGRHAIVIVDNSMGTRTRLAAPERPAAEGGTRMRRWRWEAQRALTLAALTLRRRAAQSAAHGSSAQSIRVFTPGILGVCGTKWFDASVGTCVFTIKIIKKNMKEARSWVSNGASGGFLKLATIARRERFVKWRADPSALIHTRDTRRTHDIAGNHATPFSLPLPAISLASQRLRVRLVRATGANPIVVFNGGTDFDTRLEIP
jgi:hypothetical protein